jgi:hypothetical protein
MPITLDGGVGITTPAVNTIDDLVGANDAQTLTNKTVAFGSNTLTDVASTNTAQTLTNKTIAAATNTVEAASGPSGSALSFRNKIINGGMQVAQRAAATLTASQLFGSVDRFMAFAYGGTGVSGSITQATGQSTATGYALHLSGVSYTLAYLTVAHRIEARDAAVLNGKTVHIKCRIKHDFGSAANFVVYLYKPASADTFAAVFSNTAIANSAAISVPNNTWTDLTLSTTLGASDATNGLEIVVFGPQQTVSSKNLYIGDFQLEAGSVSTPFESRPYSAELAMCQRYYEEFNEYALIPCVRSDWNPNYAGGGYIPYLVEKRAQPTIVETGGVWDGTIPGVVGTPTYYPRKRGTSLYLGWAGSYSSAIRTFTKLTISAEL